MDEQVAHANFRDANEALRGLGATYFIFYGTLLGAIRGGDFIDHDADVDFGVYGYEKHEAIDAWMEQLGFERGYFFGTPNHGYEQSFIRDGVKVDIFYFHDESPTGLWTPLFRILENLHTIILDFQREDVLPPVKHMFRGVRTYVPAQPEATLEAVYEDWWIPKKEWRYWCDPRNIRPETLPPV